MVQTANWREHLNANEKEVISLLDLWVEEGDAEWIDEAAARPDPDAARLLGQRQMRYAADVRAWHRRHPRDIGVEARLRRRGHKLDAERRELYGL